MTVLHPWPNGPISLSPGQRLGRCPRLRNDAPLARKKITMMKHLMTRLAKIEDEIAKGRKELEGLLK